ncbi:hypothetical protein ZWY2020_049856 [Hordeum vulgare]|uniref:Predicted protein n=1 Tax=Hordeum vulgare subsp. vulgare TaxID=112509 RepID=F2EKG7_HORVV|nr:hypothetical protein ZWY2020_049856 [Hordeum vulgare]BAK07839.1 predicted protein [Hordeum vulgare subsp. vulgare]
MAGTTTTTPTGGGGGAGQGGRRTLGLLASAAKRKDGFLQLLLMSGILMMSLRSLSQKHRVRDLANDAAELSLEQEHITHRMRELQGELEREAGADASGAFAPHLRRIFAAHPPIPTPAAAAEDK